MWDYYAHRSGIDHVQARLHGSSTKCGTPRIARHPVAWRAITGLTGGNDEADGLQVMRVGVQVECPQ